MGSKETDSSKDIFVGNIPTNVEYVSVLESVATHLSQMLSRHEDIKKVTSSLKGSDRTTIAELTIKKQVVASIRLVFSHKNGKALACRGFGFLTLLTDDFKPEDIFQHFTSLAKEEPLTTTLVDGTEQTATLFFKYGSAGTETDSDKEKLLKEKKAELVQSAGQQLLERVKEKGGTMHIREWTSQQNGFHLMGKKVKITPSDVAKAAGMNWSGEKMLFSIKTEGDADADEKMDDVAPVKSKSAEEVKQPKKKGKSQKKSVKKQTDEKKDEEDVAPVASASAEEDKDEKEEPKKKRKSEKKSVKKAKKVRKD